MSESKTKFKGRVANLILRFLVFGVYVALGMVIIVEIEKPESDENQRKLKLLSDLQINITAKYNLSKEEFESLANTIYNAKSPSPIKWTYINGLSFIIQLVTTIGKFLRSTMINLEAVLDYFARKMLTQQTLK